MSTFRKWCVLTALILIAVCLTKPAHAMAEAAPSADTDKLVYSYFITDPLTEIHIAVITRASAAVNFEYRKAGDTAWVSHGFTRNAAVPGISRVLREVHLTQLRPDTRYEIRFSAGADSPVFSFQTLPKTLDAPLSIVSGGDLFHNAALMTPVTAAAARDNPMLAAIGGDWAYADGNPEKVWRWLELFRVWMEHMVTPDGRMVPFVPGIGNHEVVGGYGTDPGLAPLYFTFFNLPDKRAWFTLDAGDYLSLIMLDTNHTSRIDGPQREWLRAELERLRDVPHVFPVYHVPAWPSFRPLTNAHSQQVRDHWVPLFEQHGIQLAFENHDHTFKRTKPIRMNQVDPTGVVYVGDGSWGVSTRRANDIRQRWWLEKVTDDHHYWHLLLLPDTRMVTARNEHYQIIDSFEQRIPLEDGMPVLPGREALPEGIFLYQNYPNPFNAGTVIRFMVPDEYNQKPLRLELFNTGGQRVATLYNGPVAAGMQQLVFDPSRYALSSGTYVYKLQIGGQVRSRQMQLVK
ncbi:Por secretion system C-terminal sorting domain-containing protein [Cyclonatronum proteinivorum]|uniref:Por secretion system C-terminal sorting domain-containing protein n=1 Tax=Cyclonatronum proteinivorum TaxID=1457365 RepID=A0A345UNE1_9BACT|nr:T9SS type A sorting domain-containing protein [Cyclonatronum proteinivorum]AXJ01993.1 Por secretion system C-terminal sorting domain-containing protein [Cyclonatronum proteinivorum]